MPAAPAASREPQPADSGRFQTAQAFRAGLSEAKAAADDSAQAFRAGLSEAKAAADDSGQAFRAGLSEAKAAADEEAPEPGAKPRGAIQYSTTGIDREMAKLGLRRPVTCAEILPSAWEQVRSLLPEVRKGPSPKQYPQLTEIVGRLRGIALGEAGIVPALQTHYPEEMALAGHAVSTAVLAMTIGRHCDCDDSEIQLLGVAGLLHEIRLVGGDGNYVPEASEIEAGVLAQFGAETARKLEAPAALVTALEQHQERADASGPLRLRAKEIVTDAQILLLATCFEYLYYQRWDRFRGTRLAAYAAKTNRRISRNTDPIYVIVHELRNWFQPGILKALIFANGFYSTGSIVELNNGAVARVVAQNPNNPTLPQVEIISTSLGERPLKAARLDLSQTGGIAIRKTLSYNPPGSSL